MNGPRFDTSRRHELADAQDGTGIALASPQMPPPGVRRFVKVTMLFTVALSGAAATIVPPAHADPADNAFVNALEQQYNIRSVGGPGDLIYAGHQVCGFLSPSTSPPMVVDYVSRASLYGHRFYAGAHQPLSGAQASMLVDLAISTYCPNSVGAKYW